VYITAKQKDAYLSMLHLTHTINNSNCLRRNVKLPMLLPHPQLIKSTHLTASLSLLYVWFYWLIF